MAVLLAAGEICNMVLEACLAEAAKNLASGGGNTLVADSGVKNANHVVDGLFVSGQTRRQFLRNRRRVAVARPGQVCRFVQDRKGSQSAWPNLRRPTERPDSIR